MNACHPSQPKTKRKRRKPSAAARKIISVKLKPVQDTCGSRVGCHTAQPGAVTAIPGVVFSGSLDGHLRAYATDTGRVIWDADTVGEYDTVNGVPGQGGALNGPGATIAGGMLYVSSGYNFLGYMAGNVLLAFSVDGQ